VILFGGFDSFRREGIAEKDGPGEIETVRTESAAAS